MQLQVPRQPSCVARSSKRSNVNVGSLIADLPKTPNQVRFCKMLDNDTPLILATGAAGVGKTLMSVSYAVHKLINKDVDRVVITRPTVPLEEELGHLPGKLQDKMHPYLVPIYDSFKQYVTVHQLQDYIVNEQIEIAAIAHMRGRTFHNSWVIVDEAQNLTTMQMKTLLTRIGQNTKMVVSGDLEQSDLRSKNGLQDFVERYRLHGPSPLIDMMEFAECDIMRSEVVRSVLDVYKG